MSKSHLAKDESRAQSRDARDETGVSLLLPGRWHGVTRDQEAALKEALADHPGRLVFVITAMEQARTKRHPLDIEERKEVVAGLAEALGRPYEIHAVKDIADSTKWVEHVKAVVADESKGATDLNPESTLIVTSNPDVLGWFEKRGYKSLTPSAKGKMPADLHAAIRKGTDWRKLATEATVRVFEAHGLVNEIAEIFQDVLLTDDGELTHGRDYKVYGSGMDASKDVKVNDVVRYIQPGGKLVDKGCGTGSMLVVFSELFPETEIIGMDMSTQLLHTAESQYYPNHNVAVVRGNIIHQRFAPGSLRTVLYCSVMHEVFSYNGYDREQVRLALRNTRTELELGGRLIIRDGIKPGAGDKKIWLRCNAETEERFRRFATDFKNKSDKPGIEYAEKKIDGETWFHLTLHEANEFLSKKDYLVNWAQEVNEEFGVFTTD